MPLPALSPPQVLWAAPLTAGASGDELGQPHPGRKGSPGAEPARGFLIRDEQKRGPAQVAGAWRAHPVAEPGEAREEGSVYEGARLGLVGPGHFALDLF